MESPLVLYSYFRSSASYRVRIGLYLKKLDFDYRAIHLLNNGGEQHQDEYRKLNPMREVPVLVHGASTIGQSMAILQYLDKNWELPRLFPSNPALNARVVQICEMVNSGIHPIQNLKVLQQLERRFGADQNAKNEWAKYWIQTGFEAIEKMLQTSAGEFCFGDQITAADLFLVPQVLNARRFQVDLSAFPLIEKINSSCAAVEAFQRAHPSRQPDTPSDYKG